MESILTILLDDYKSVCTRICKLASTHMSNQSITFINHHVQISRPCSIYGYRLCLQDIHTISVDAIHDTVAISEGF